MREKLKRWREEKALKKKMDAQEKAKKKPFIIKHAVPTEKINPSVVKREVADPSKVRWFLRLPLIRWNIYVDKIFIDQYFDDFLMIISSYFMLNHLSFHDLTNLLLILNLVKIKHYATPTKTSK